MKKQTPHKPLPKSVKWLWGIVFAPFALLLLLLLLTAAGLFGRLPSFEELENPKSNLRMSINHCSGYDVRLTIRRLTNIKGDGRGT